MPFITRKKLKAMQDAADAVIEQATRMENMAILIGIERKGRENIFTFARGTQVFQINTMGMISDDFGQWRKDLLE